LKEFEGETPMFEQLGIFKMSSAMASHAGRRQALVAQNMANVDTPGYSAKRLPSFAEMTETPGQHPALRATRSSHLHGARAETAIVRVFEDQKGVSPDGNSVSVETEMLEAIEVKREHDRSLAIYKSALKILHANLSRS